MTVKDRHLTPLTVDIDSNPADTPGDSERLRKRQADARAPSMRNHQPER